MPSATAIQLNLYVHKLLNVRDVERKLSDPVLEFYIVTLLWVCERSIDMQSHFILLVFLSLHYPIEYDPILEGRILDRVEVRDEGLVTAGDYISRAHVIKILELCRRG